MPPSRFPVCLLLHALGLGVARAAISDFTTWTLVEDPPHPEFSAVASSGRVTLSAADGSIPTGTDIGFQSVAGATPASSLSGFSFDPGADFTIAIDYAWSFSGVPNGYLGLGLGIGEDGGGANSAGALMVTANGAPFFTYGGAARVDDVGEPNLSLSTFSTLSGSLFVAFDALSGDITIGASTTPGAASPDSTATFAGLQKEWAGSDLLASFFIRSVEGTPGWQGGGTADAALTNFRVLEGAAILIPEPTALGLAVALGIGLGVLVRRRRFCA